MTQFDDTGYRDRYVAFLDILGFSDLTKKADQHPNWRAWLKDCIGVLHDTLPASVEATGFRYVQFSDSIVISVHGDPQGLAALIQGVHLLFRNMLGRGILLRGGIAAGNFHHDDQLMFGPALIRAYAFEQHGAPPHIGIDTDVLEDFKPSLLGPGCQQWLAEDPWDLSPMLHTLIEFATYDGTIRGGYEPLDEPAAHLARMINENARNMSSPAAVRAKWRWMQDYWNQSVTPGGLLLTSRTYSDWNAELARVKQAERARLVTHNIALALANHRRRPRRH